MTLEVVQGQEWSTVRSWDNSHDRHEHHLHRYTKTGGRGDPELLAHAFIQVAMSQALADGAQSWEAILQSWEH